MASKDHNLLTSEKDGKFFNVPNALYKNRYCNQDDLNIMICGGYIKQNASLNDVYELKGTNLLCNHFSCMLEARYDCKSVVTNSDILVVGGYKKNW